MTTKKLHILKHPIKIEVPSDLYFSLLVRDFVKNGLELLGLSSIWVRRLVLVADELFMNSCKYGSRKTDDTIDVSIRLEKDQAIISVEDSGGDESMNPEKLLKLMRDNQDNKNLLKSSGRGLAMIMTEWTDTFEVGKSDKGGIKITIYKHIN